MVGKLTEVMHHLVPPFGHLAKKIGSHSIWVVLKPKPNPRPRPRARPRPRHGAAPKGGKFAPPPALAKNNYKLPSMISDDFGRNKNKSIAEDQTDRQTDKVETPPYKFKEALPPH